MSKRSKTTIHIITCLAAGCGWFVLLAQEASVAPPAGLGSKREHPSVAAPSKGSPHRAVKQKDGRLSGNQVPDVRPGANVHVVKAGESLWEIARQYLKNPYLWPQIWEKNRYISNPHWIWPGDPIIVDDPKLVDAPEVVGQTGGGSQPVEPAEPLSLMKTPKKRESAYKPLQIEVKELELYYGTQDELYGTGRIFSTHPTFDTFVVGGEDELNSRNFSRGSALYVNKGVKRGVSPGQRFSILRSAGEIKHPTTGKFAGFYYQEMGTLKIIVSREADSVGVIEWSSRPIYVGDALVPYSEKEKVKKDRERKPVRFSDDNSKSTGCILFMNDKMNIAGQGNVVYIDLGKKDNISLGQFCTVYRANRPFKPTNEYYPDFRVDNFKEKRDRSFRDEGGRAVSHRGTERVIIGELVVIEVFENTAKAKVVDSRGQLMLGNAIQLQ